MMERVTANVTENGDVTLGRWGGGLATFSATGTWNDASVQLEARFDPDAEWIEIDDAVLSDDGAMNVTTAPCELRVAVSGAGASTDVDVRVDMIDTARVRGR
jgi:hypothetical protein